MYLSIGHEIDWNRCKRGVGAVFAMGSMLQSGKIHSLPGMSTDEVSSCHADWGEGEGEEGGRRASRSSDKLLRPLGLANVYHTA